MEPKTSTEKITLYERAKFLDFIYEFRLNMLIINTLLSYNLYTNIGNCGNYTGQTSCSCIGVIFARCFRIINNKFLGMAKQLPKRLKYAFGR